jgi:hypothetical protein
VPLIGNQSNICLLSQEMHLSDSLPSDLTETSVIMLFSGSTSSLLESDLDRIIEFVAQGGGLYLGSENWPLQAESNQLTTRLYNKECYGEFEKAEAQFNVEEGNLDLRNQNYIPAGKTTVAFPLDHRLTVEAWVEDQPLILTGKIGEGHIIIDGGYSRFYCDQRNDESDLLFFKMIEYLGGNKKY